MAQIDTNALRWLDVFGEAVKFRLQPADPASEGTITITREVFDHLVAVVDAACKADGVQPGYDELVAREQDGKHVVTLHSKVFGTVEAEGRSLLEAIAKAKWEFRWAVERRLS
jgi:hypothetical protein